MGDLSRSEDEDNSTIDDPGSWRYEVCRSAAKLSVVLFSVATILLAISLQANWQRIGMLLVSSLCVVMSAVLAFTGRPRGPMAAWLVVLPAAMSSLVGFATIGFLAGPASIATCTMLLAGLLLGTRAMLLVLVVIVSAIGAIGWAMIHGVIEAPHPLDVSMTEATPWLRTVGVMLLATSLIGTMAAKVISRMQRSAEHLREQTRRRHEAEEARSRAELQALSSKHLEMVGQLASGVAHDFNNNLAAIIGSVELMLEERQAKGPDDDLLEDVLASARRAAQLTRQLLVYSSRAQMVLAPVDLHLLIDRTVALLKRSMDPRIELLTQLDADPPHVLADAALLDNAILNLIVNARDAMPKGGRIKIVTSNLALPSGHDNSDAASGACVLLEVIDSGEGIPAAAIPHIFEPFFTTKEMGKGTGLGLASVAGTIKSLKGSIEVESEPGSGTAFRIQLRRAEALTSTLMPGAHGVPTGNGRILLVDDEPLVRKAAASTLRRFGYDVTSATDGLNALELVRAEKQGFDLVILDLRMPKMDGPETFNALIKQTPELPVLIWSANGTSNEVNALLAKGAAGFISKPYQIAELGRKVYEVLHRSGNNDVEDSPCSYASRTNIA